MVCQDLCWAQSAELPRVWPYEFVTFFQKRVDLRFQNDEPKNEDESVIFRGDTGPACMFSLGGLIEAGCVR